MHVTWEMLWGNRRGLSRPCRTVPQDPWRTLAEASVTVAVPLKRLFCDLGRGGGEGG